MIIDAIILAGGKATRLKTLATNTPKSLIEVAGIPFIAHQLRMLKGNRIRHVVICAGHLGKKIREYVRDGSAFGLGVEYSFDGPKPLGTGGAINKALGLVGDAFFVMYGDSYLSLDLKAVSAYFTRHKKNGLMTLIKNNNRWDKSNVLYINGRIKKYDKTNPDRQMRHIDYGLSILTKVAFAQAKLTGAFDLEELLQVLIRRNDLIGYEAKERFYEIGSPSGLAETRKYLSGLTGS